MSGHFPRLNLDKPADLDHVLRVIDSHARKVAQMEFGSELERDKALKAVVDKMVKRVRLVLYYSRRFPRRPIADVRTILITTFECSACYRPPVNRRNKSQDRAELALQRHVSTRIR